MPGDPGVCTDIRTVITRTLDVSIRYYLIKFGNLEIYDDLSMRYDVIMNYISLFIRQINRHLRYLYLFTW